MEWIDRISAPDEREHLVAVVVIRLLWHGYRMTGTLEQLDARVARRFAGRLASRVQSNSAASVTQIVSWLDLVDLCREIDDALLEVQSPSREALALHNAVLSLAIGSGTWLLHQVDNAEINPEASGHTREALAASLEFVQIMHSSSHTPFRPEQIAAVQERIFNAAA